MSTQVRYEDLFDDNLFKQLEDNLEATKRKVQELASTFIKSARAIAKTAAALNLKELIDSFSKVRAEYAKLSNAINFAAKYEKELAKLRAANKELANSVKELADAQSDEGVKVEILKTAYKDLSNEYKSQAQSIYNFTKVKEAYDKVVRGELRNYKDLTEALEILRLAYKDAVASNQDFVDELQMSTAELQKFVADLDKRVKRIDESVGQFQRNVGAYKEKVVESFIEVGGTVAEELGASKDIISKFQSVFLAASQSAAAAATSVSGAINKVSAAVRAFGRSFIILTAITLAFEGLEYIISRLIGKSKELSDIFKEIDISVYSNVRIVNQYIALLEKQKNIQDALIELEKTDSLRILREKATLNAALLRTQRELLSFELQILQKRKEALLEERRKANNDERLAEINRELVQIEKERLSLSGKSLELLVESQRQYDEYNKILQETIKRIQDFENVSLNTADNIVIDYKKAVAVINETSNELLKIVQGDAALTQRVLVARAKQLAVAQQDLRESLRQVADTARETALNILSSNEAFAAIILSINNTNNQIAELEKKLIELSQVELVLKKLSSAFSVDLVQAVGDAKRQIIAAIQFLRSRGVQEYTDYIERLQDAIATTRLEFLDEEERFVREAVAKRDKLVSDLRRKQQDIITLLQSQPLDEYLRNELLSISQEIEDTIKFVIENYNQKLSEGIAEIRRINEEKERQYFLNILEIFEQTDRLSLLSERETLLERENNLERRLQIEKEYNRKLIDLQRKYIEQQIKLLERYNDLETQKRVIALKQQLVELNRAFETDIVNSFNENISKIASELNKSADAIFTVYEELFKRSLEQQLRSLDLLSQRVNNRISLLVALAQRGALNASESIAQLEKQQAEIIQQQRQLQREAQRREVFIASLRTYAAALEKTKDPVRALLDTIRNVTLIRQFAATLPTFYEGTEYVKSGFRNSIKLKNVARDAIVARVHEGERIVPASLNKKLKGISNEQLVNLVNSNSKDKVSFDYDSLHNAIVMTIANNTSRIVKYRPI